MTVWFARLALLAACTGYVLGLVLIGRWIGAGWAVAITVAGVAVAAAVTLEPDEQRTEKPSRKRRFGEERTRPYDGIDS